MATLRAQEEKADGTNRVIVSKQDMRITVLCPQGDTLAVFPIACGRNYGDKQQEWDFRTPEGHFVIENTTVSKVIGIKQTAIQKIWYGHGIGPVKTNMYNKKGKLMTSQELVSIEGL